MTYISALELFSVGIGPSSSHTVGPMRAAATFVANLSERGLLARVDKVAVVLCGSLGATGEGHGTPDAVVAGLRGLDPRTCDVEEVPGAWEALGDGAEIELAGGHRLTMARRDIRLAPLTRLPGHPNGIRLTASTTADDGAAHVLHEAVAYSIGGGFVVWEEELTDGGDSDLAAVLAETPDGDAATLPGRGAPAAPALGPTAPAPPTVAAPPSAAPTSARAADLTSFDSATELLEVCRRTGADIAEVAWAQEAALRPEIDVAAGLDAVWAAMSACVDAGLTNEGQLPGRLGVRRRASAQRARLEALEARGRSRRSRPTTPPPTPPPTPPATSPSSGCRRSRWRSTRRTPTADGW
ncbi:hypothetical protein GCM10025875_28940 [Litorihabitans aurantiacus]|uniref:L-serine dehydratase n=1 Tax=Litorihabitans aurantiacus TaxID=1930061 RepID=A0AA37XH93_9MICO|nr:hypothetical protein GCM10025875_28940 [Litorihabitans aurantiacus]